MEATEHATGVDLFTSHFEELNQHVFGLSGEWFTPIRREALETFRALGFPTTRHEEWRYTSVAPVAGTAFALSVPADEGLTSSDLKRFKLGDAERALLVFVNGHFVPRLSLLARGSDGLTVGSLKAAMAGSDPVVRAHLARHVHYEDQAFTALNTALMQDGAVVHVPRNGRIDGVIHLLFVSTSRKEPLALHPRNLIVVETSGRVSVLETHAALDGRGGFTNSVTEIVAGENSLVNHFKVERGAEKSFHIGTVHLHQQRSSRATGFTVSMGEGTVRNDVSAVLDGDGAECTLNGLYMATDDQHVDNHLVVDHAKPHCDSREVFHGVLDGRGRGIFSGRIIVREGAQKTDAKQSNMTLLLSEDAQVESKPQLEIFADDVRCTHGATIGQVSEEAIFYLRSRGVSERAARSILVYAFANECVRKIPVQPLREQLTSLFIARLPQGGLLGEGL